MSHVAMKIMLATMFFSLSACETMKNTMDSINIFDSDKATASADASGFDASADPRKHAVMRAGVDAVAPNSIGDYMDQQEAKLRRQLAGTDVTVTRIGETIILSMPGSATFVSGSSSVDSEFFPVLESVAVVLDEFDQTYVDVIGHTDSKGSRQYNQRLSEKRAQSVASYFESREVISERVIADGMGEVNPIAPNDTRAGRAQNRRVEIKLKPVT
ncbi:MAG: OmpA family protein [Gammaproteobacteria bacterium]|nr:OmpA family protein [Gammaproteobacteria bacterium]